MKIAIVVERYDPRGGGAERSTRQIAEELTRRGHEVTLLAGATAQQDDAADASTIQNEPGRIHLRACPTATPRTGLGLLRFARWIERELSDRSFDASLSVTTAAPADVLQPRSGIVREFQLRNIARRRTPLKRGLKRLALALSPKQRALRWAEARTLRSPRVKRFIAISDYVRRQLREHFHIPDDRITVIHNAVVTPTWPDDQRQRLRAAVRANLSIANANTAYLFIAQNPALKGFSSLTASFAELTRERTDVVLIVAGCWSYRLEQHVQRLGIREQVRFVGRTSQPEALYCAADVCVLPSYFDPSSKVILEALAMGVTAITTRYNGASDLVVAPAGATNHPPRGIVIPDTDDLPALTEALRALADPQRRRACQAATAGLDDTLSMRRHVDRLETILEAVATQ